VSDSEVECRDRVTGGEAFASLEALDDFIKLKMNEVSGFGTFAYETGSGLIFFF
jgi:hypothetical protein